MSNFNYERFPDEEREIIAGSEVVNGTGQVSLKFYGGEVFDGEDQHMVFCLMDYQEVLELAGWLADQAFAAMREQWREKNLLSG